MHSKTNYPAKKSNSDLDVELEDNLEDDKYIKTLKHYLNELNQENFDFVFYIAGAVSYTHLRAHETRGKSRMPSSA